MKTRITVSLIALATVMLAQCKSQKETSMAQSNATQKETTQGDPMKQLLIDMAYEWPGSTDPFRILSAEVSSEDSLIVEVEYGGGCKDHVFRLVTNGILKKSMPPQCTIYLEHENNDDMCRALLRQKVSFYIGNIAKSGETIVVQLHDFDSIQSKLILNPAKK